MKEIKIIHNSGNLEMNIERMESVIGEGKKN